MHDEPTRREAITKTVILLSIITTLAFYILNIYIPLFNPLPLLILTLPLIYFGYTTGSTLLSVLPTLFIVSAYWAYYINTNLYINISPESLNNIRHSISAIPVLPLCVITFFIKPSQILSPEYLNIIKQLPERLRWGKDNRSAQEIKTIINKDIASHDRVYLTDQLRISEDIVFAHEKTYTRDGILLPTGKSVKLTGDDRYLHTLITGPTGSGKSKGLLLPMMEQEIKAISQSLPRGIPRGLTLIEPKGDLVNDVYDMCRYYGVPVVRIDPTWEQSSRFNPLHGDPTIVAEGTRTVLGAIFHQKDFFSKVQEMASRNTVALLKYLYGNDVTMRELSVVLREQSKLKMAVDRLKNYAQNPATLQDAYDKAVASKDEEAIHRYKLLLSIPARLNDLVSYFEQEVFGPLAESQFKFALGLRLQVEDIAGNEMLDRIINYPSDINLDTHLMEGGVLLVNTAMGLLGRVGDIFGAFITMHFQNAVFRRPGDEDTRARHMLVIDEAHRYLNPDFERVLAMGRSYRCECIIALQNTSQLIQDYRQGFRNSVLNLCRNKITYGGMDATEAQFYSKEFGEELRKKTMKQTKGTILYRKPWDGIRYTEREEMEPRFTYTRLMELPSHHVAYRIVNNNTVLPPGIGETRLSEWQLGGKPSLPGVTVKGLRARRISDSVRGDKFKI